MFFSSPKTFEDAIKPLVLLNCHAGIGTFRRQNQSDSAYFFMQLYTIIISFLHWTMIYIAFMVISQAPNFRKASPMAAIMYNVLLYTNSCVAVIGPFLIWRRRKELKNCLRRVPILDATLQGVLGARNEYKKEYIRLICHIIALFVAMAVGSNFNNAWSKEYNASVFTTFCVTITVRHPILVMFVLDLNFRTFVGYLGNKFRDLNNALLRLAETPEPASYSSERLFKISQNVQRGMTQRNKTRDTEPEGLINDKHYFLEEIRKTHFEMCKLTREINSIFGMQNLLSSGISFGMITGLLYTVYSAFVWKRVASTVSKEMVSSAMWAAIYIFKIWMINHSCWSVSYEAQRTGEIIYELLHLKAYKEVLRDEIRVFALQMIQNPVRFDACGFFILDYTFVQAMIGSITTYLVILIQISQLSERTTIAIYPFKNSTEI